jgi:pyridoxal phosphate enzyme (YggS family)
MKVAEKLETIKQKIKESCRKVNRNPEEIRIIAVTKYVSTERAKEAFEAGITDLGENRDDGLLNKYEVLRDKPIYHFIGSLQTRKVKNMIDIADYIHSLDRINLAEEINKRSQGPINCLVQVNVSGEESKHGLNAGEVIPFIRQLASLENIRVVGLMTMAPHTVEESILRTCFRKLRELRDEVQALQLDHAPCAELSMGMSNDYPIAIEEGATMVRIGTALVGEDD